MDDPAKGASPRPRSESTEGPARGCFHTEAGSPADAAAAGGADEAGPGNCGEMPSWPRPGGRWSEVEPHKGASSCQWVRTGRRTAQHDASRSRLRRAEHGPWFCKSMGLY